MQIPNTKKEKAQQASEKITQVTKKNRIIKCFKRKKWRKMHTHLCYGGTKREIHL